METATSSRSPVRGAAQPVTSSNASAGSTVMNTEKAKSVDAQHAALLLRYGAGVSFEEKVAFLTEQLADLDHVKEWKNAVKKELSKPDYSIDHLQSVRCLSTPDNPLLYCVLEKMGLVNSLKRAVMDLHYAATQAAMTASAKQIKEEDTLFIPEMQGTHGCNLDVVLKARENWETITREEMLRFANETGRPLIAAVTGAVATLSSIQQSATPGDDPSTENLSDQMSKPNKPSATRFLYDG